MFLVLVVWCFRQLTLEERVSASSTNLTPTKNVPRADSLAVLLSQGLQSKDRDILNVSTCLLLLVRRHGTNRRLFKFKPYTRSRLSLGKAVAHPRSGINKSSRQIAPSSTSGIFWVGALKSLFDMLGEQLWYFNTMEYGVVRWSAEI